MNIIEEIPQFNWDYIYQVIESTNNKDEMSQVFNDVYNHIVNNPDNQRQISHEEFASLSKLIFIQNRLVINFVKELIIRLNNQKILTESDLIQLRILLQAEEKYRSIIINEMSTLTEEMMNKLHEKSKAVILEILKDRTKLSRAKVYTRKDKSND